MEAKDSDSDCLALTVRRKNVPPMYPVAPKNSTVTILWMVMIKKLFDYDFARGGIKRTITCHIYTLLKSRYDPFRSGN